MTKDGNQGDVGSNPAQGIKSFFSNENVIQTVVRPWYNSLHFAEAWTVNPLVILSWGQRWAVGSRDLCNLSIYIYICKYKGGQRLYK